MNESRPTKSVTNATVVNGAGVPPFTADLGINATRRVADPQTVELSLRIDDMGDLGTDGALETIDAMGLVVAPLFGEGVLQEGQEVAPPAWTDEHCSQHLWGGASRPVPRRSGRPASRAVSPRRAGHPADGCLEKRAPGAPLWCLARAPCLVRGAGSLDDGSNGGGLARPALVFWGGVVLAVTGPARPVARDLTAPEALFSLRDAGQAEGAEPARPIPRVVRSIGDEPKVAMRARLARADRLDHPRARRAVPASARPSRLSSGAAVRARRRRFQAPASTLRRLLSC